MDPGRMQEFGIEALGRRCGLRSWNCTLRPSPQLTTAESKSYGHYNMLSSVVKLSVKLCAIAHRKALSLAELRLWPWPADAHNRHWRGGGVLNRSPCRPTTCAFPTCPWPGREAMNHAKGSKGLGWAHASPLVNVDHARPQGYDKDGEDICEKDHGRHASDETRG
jgi:hypothetical protein